MRGTHWEHWCLTDTEQQAKNLFCGHLTLNAISLHFDLKSNSTLVRGNFSSSVQYVVASCHHLRALADATLLAQCKLLSIVWMNIWKAPTNEFVCFATCSIHALYNLLGLLAFLLAGGHQVRLWAPSLFPKGQQEGQMTLRETLSETGSTARLT